MLRRFIFACSFALAAQAQAAEAGKVIFTAGASHVAERAAAEGVPVQEGELLSTGADGYIYVKTIDNGLFILRPNTRARIVTYYVDNANPANTKVKLELISGVARSKSGDAVKLARQNFRFNTPVAAIGVRGTDFTVFTDQDTSRVAVLTGGVVVSSFGGACRPEGAGPCEGAASRELFAAQRGQLLQVKRGQAAPQLLPASSGAPDQVTPPRSDEPVAKVGSPSDSVIDARKVDSVEKYVQHQPTLPSTPPVVEVVTPPVAQLPERELQWGRWADVMGRPATISLTGPNGAERVISGDYVLFRTAGKDYVAPERGNVAFLLSGSEAYILNDNPNKNPVLGQLQNGLLSVDFGKQSFATSFDLIGDGSTFKLHAEGQVSPDGRFANNLYERPASNNMQVDGMLSNANGGSAAYLFRSRLDESRSVSGFTSWTR
ncbi:FecR family protein [Massilia solisilvae]|uniref:FecR family protein n=1 Tax=Massilia solisilvae TaxID=1811225 RepID=A0ABT2BFQ4_9BURK|nr:FecR family protein [Massilia solisilvae]MCS0606753.1 FecR family protein [Massilia solisilvae]